MGDSCRWIPEFLMDGPFSSNNTVKNFTFFFLNIISPRVGLSKHLWFIIHKLFILDFETHPLFLCWI